MEGKDNKSDDILNNSNLKDNKDEIDNTKGKEENKSEEIYGYGDPVLEDFGEMVGKIFARGLLVIFILKIIWGIRVGEFKINMIPFIITHGAAYVLLNLLTFPRFEKNTVWIIIWMVILMFISLFAYPH